MKLLHITDLHFQKQQFNWTLQASQQADVICITGDFISGRYDEPFPIAEQIDWIIEWLNQLNGPVFICSGNHDLSGIGFNASWLTRSPSNGHIDNSIINLSGVVFGCIPFGCEDYERFSECDVLLHHEPPSGLKVAKQAGRDFGSRQLRSALSDGTLTPDWILCGHVHQPQAHLSRFRNTRISNPGASRKSKVPNHHWVTLTQL